VANLDIVTDNFRPGTMVTGRAAPRLGEHNREVYGKELGLSSQALSALLADGVI
jgi:crotonobetainyl-CoA:carnitine CoA-transferase CaiB-like acyl-CoA transferase